MARGDELAHQSRVLRRMQPYASEAAMERGPIELLVVPAAGGAFYAQFWAARDVFGLYTAIPMLSLSVRRGRQGANETPTAGTLTFSYPVDGPGDHVKVGDRVKMAVQPEFWYFLLDVTDPGAGGYDPNLHSNGYEAWITDVELAYVPQGDGRPPQAVAHVTATGPKARGNQVKVGDVPWPDEAIGTRLNRIYAAANPKAWPSILLPPLSNWGIPSEPVVVTARDVDAQPPVGLLDELAADVGAIVGESVRYPNRIIWQSMDARSGKDPIVTLEADEVAATATWGLSLTGLVNRYTVEYGPTDARATVTVEDAESIATFGEYAASRTTQLRDLSDAERLAGLIVGRNSRPRWSITRFEVDLLDLALPRAKAAELLRAEFGDLVEAAGLPATAPSDRYFFVEGSELTQTRHELRLVLYVSDAGRTGAPMTWADVPAGLTWDQADPELSWLTAAGWFELPPISYRWADVPADWRWSQLAPGEIRPDGDDRAPTWASYPDDPA